MGECAGDARGDGLGDGTGEAFGDGLGDDCGDDRGVGLCDGLGDGFGDGFGDGSGDGLADESGEGFGDVFGDDLGEGLGDGFGEGGGGGFGEGFVVSLVEVAGDGLCNGFAGLVDPCTKSFGRGKFNFVLEANFEGISIVLCFFAARGGDVLVGWCFSVDCGVDLFLESFPPFPLADVVFFLAPSFAALAARAAAGARCLASVVAAFDYCTWSK